MERVNPPGQPSPSRPGRSAACYAGAQLGWLIFTSVSQSVTLRLEEFLDSLGVSPGPAARALDAWVVLPILAIGIAYAYRHGMNSTREGNWRPLAVIATVTLLCTAFFFANRPFLLHRFGPVREDVLYRSAQMGEATLRRAIDQYDIRTLVVLRNSDEVLERESRLARSEGIRFIHIPMDETEQGVAHFLEVVEDPNNQPVLAHCRHGVARTGVVSAVYRMEYDAWSNSDALAEARRIGGYDTLNEGSRKREFILSYKSGGNPEAARKNAAALARTKASSSESSDFSP